MDGLTREGVKHVFGLPGNPDALYDSLYDSTIEPILVRHESSGAFMAMCYSKLKRRPGVCFGSPGPGVSNLVPGVLEAWSGCIPLLALGGSAALTHEGEGAFQEAPQLDFFRGISKWSFRIPMASRASWAVRRAFTIAVNGKPGPVYLEVPFDVGQEKTDVDYMYPSVPFIRFRPDPEAVKRSAELILVAQRPVIVAGGGALYSGASAEIIELSETLGIPILTTPSGRGIIPEDHPMALGQVGLYRTRLGRDAYRSSDLVISLGSRNEEFQTASWSYFPEEASLIQVDIDPTELGRNLSPAVPVVADVKLFLSDLLELIKRRIEKVPFIQIPRVRFNLDATAAYIAEVDAECRDESSPIKSKKVVYEACRIFGPKTILVNENGSQDLWSYYWPYWAVGAIDGCIAPAEQTCMGFGVAGCIGAKLAAPERPVICTTGDGAFQMFMKELPTAVQYKAPVTWIVLNNFSLGWIKLHEKVRRGRFLAVDFDVQPDFVKIAEASGCYGEKVIKPDGIKSALLNALKENQRGIPSVLDFIVDPWDFPEGFKEMQPDLFR